MELCQKKAAKCEQKSVERPRRHEIICNQGIEVSGIKMSDGPIADRVIKIFKDRDDILKKGDRWTIDFQYGPNNFVVYFSEDAAKDFRKKVDESFSRPT